MNMQNALLSIATGLLALGAGEASVGVTPNSNVQLGKIVMYRGSSIMGAGLACPIRYKGQEIVELARGKYAEWSVPPGRYILTNHTSSVEVAVDPGETRYVRCMIKTGMLTGRADLQIVDEESFNEHRNEYELKPLDAAPFSSKTAGPGSNQR
jgi:hypothetical protein